MALSFSDYTVENGVCPQLFDDGGDSLIVNENFDSTDTTIAYDKAGNLIDDGSMQFQYDAWNRLVKVRSAKNGNATIQTAEFDGTGRRIKKVVTNTGEFDATFVYYFDGQKIVETRNGSNVMVQQFIHGTRYIDELIQIRVKDKGDLYVHQDANWNVTALTDLGGTVVERYQYTPYGEVTVQQDTSYGDRDGDLDVDSTDKGTVGVTCTGTVTGACRILDLDFDGDYDSADATKFDSLTQGQARHPGKTSTGVDQPFAHQGLLYEPEIASYQNRARQYEPGRRLFTQRDPINLRQYFRLAQIDGLNRYAYTRANPILAIDPSGLTSCSYNDNCSCVSSVTCCTGLSNWGTPGIRGQTCCDDQSGSAIPCVHPSMPDGCERRITCCHEAKHADDFNHMFGCNSGIGLCRVSNLLIAFWECRGYEAAVNCFHAQPICTEPPLEQRDETNCLICQNECMAQYICGRPAGERMNQEDINRISSDCRNGVLTPPSGIPCAPWCNP